MVSGLSAWLLGARLLTPVAAQTVKVVETRAIRLQLAGFVSSEVGEHEVRSSILGFLYGQRAAYREGIGCTLLHSGRDFDEGLAAVRERVFEPLGMYSAEFETDEAPSGANRMSGFQGQVAYVFLEQELVVVRLGATYFTWSVAHRLAADVAAAPSPDTERVGQVDLVAAESLAGLVAMTG